LYQDEGDNYCLSLYYRKVYSYWRFQVDYFIYEKINTFSYSIQIYTNKDYYFSTFANKNAFSNVRSDKFLAELNRNRVRLSTHVAAVWHGGFSRRFLLFAVDETQGSPVSCYVSVVLGCERVLFTKLACNVASTRLSRKIKESCWRSTREITPGKFSKQFRATRKRIFLFSFSLSF